MSINEINQFFARISTTNDYCTDDIMNQMSNIAAAEAIPPQDEIPSYIVEKLLRCMKSTARLRRNTVVGL